ncbi:MAG: type I 3-dehydroquinate dehydratase [Planctomycetaceae bacterium]
MICISVSPESRTLAKVDLLNAAARCDLVELGLDHLIKEPNVAELMEDIPKPILLSCRSKEQGGAWEGTEQERITLLRQAIVSGPAYIELDLETAKSIPRFGKTKRVISYTSLDRPLTSNIESIFEQAKKVNADVVKFTWPTPTLEAAWPLLSAVSKKRDIPVVGLGLGRAGLTFSLLGRKYGSPWIYAALEKGMEQFENQATVFELDETYGWRTINAQTRLLAISGLGDAEATTVRTMNKMFDKIKLNMRCLPVATEKFDKFKQMLDALKVNVLVAAGKTAEEMLPLAEKMEEVTQMSQHGDLLIKQNEVWTAYNSLWRSAVKALEAALGKGSTDARPLDRRNIMVLGSGGLAKSMIFGIAKRKGLVSVSSSNDKEAQALAVKMGVRFVPYQNLYNTLADVVVFADPDMQLGGKKDEFNPAYLRASMMAIDVTTMPGESPVMKEARERGAKTVDPVDVYAEQLATQFKSATGQELLAAEFRKELTAVPE